MVTTQSLQLIESLPAAAVTLDLALNQWQGLKHGASSLSLRKDFDIFRDCYYKVIFFFLSRKQLPTQYGFHANIIVVYFHVDRSYFLHFPPNIFFFYFDGGLVLLKQCPGFDFNMANKLKWLCYV